VCIRKRNHAGPYRESEGLIVPFEGTGQHNPARGKDPCFVHATEGRRVLEIAYGYKLHKSPGRYRGSSVVRPSRMSFARQAGSLNPFKASISYFYACLAMKNIGKPCAGKPHARIDEGRLMDDQSGRHVIVARGEALMEGPAAGLISASYSTLFTLVSFLLQELFGKISNCNCNDDSEHPFDQDELAGNSGV